MARHVRQGAVIQSGALHRPVVETEAYGFDDVQVHAEARRQSDAGADVLRNVRLKKGETHSKASNTRDLGVCRGLFCERFSRSVSNLRRGAASRGPAGILRVRTCGSAPDREVPEEARAVFER